MNGDGSIVWHYTTELPNALDEGKVPRKAVSNGNNLELFFKIGLCRGKGFRGYYTTTRYYKKGEYTQ